MESIESRFVIGPSNILFEGVYVCTFQPGNCTGCGREGVNKERMAVWSESFPGRDEVRCSWSK